MEPDARIFEPGDDSMQFFIQCDPYLIPYRSPRVIWVEPSISKIGHLSPEHKCGGEIYPVLAYHVTMEDRKRLRERIGFENALPVVCSCRGHLIE